MKSKGKSFAFQKNLFKAQIMGLFFRSPRFSPEKSFSQKLKASEQKILRVLEGDAER
jgi:hypothetical protein